MDIENCSNEALFFDKTDNLMTRKVSWSSIPSYQSRIIEGLDLLKEVRCILEGNRYPKCLTLACGDMSGEYSFFSNLNASHIDAFDISQGQKEKFIKNVYDHKIPVDYSIADVNKIELCKKHYDVVYMSQSLHHLTDIEKVLYEIKTSLKDGGIFVLNDYIGEPFLQRSVKQREIVSKLWQHLPARYRKNHSGVLFNTPHIPLKESLSPFEAVCSDAIVPALRNIFACYKEFMFGGILFPLLNGFAQNYCNTEFDDCLLNILWDIDQFMIKSEAIEPNFIRGIYTV